ncbi:putative OsmC-like protein [Geomicrobium halophilum]|uniref:Putative OsmC-like protein n=1 Tax=Geomicrobium halophilum TaxID=549000 RepID=A0A841PPG4_9BACL|nr:OsmC family protein [Geomicrobium halophilum]MBB6450660.1 putative OsmC-like protein [Geomicrobium halophilum]
MDFRIENEEAFNIESPYGKLVISGNEEHGFRPYQLLVSSIAGCSGSVLRKIMRKRRIEINDIRIHADVTRNDAEPHEVEEVHLHFNIDAVGVKDEQMAKMMTLTKKNCSIVQSVEPAIKITETFTLE